MQEIDISGHVVGAQELRSELLGKQIRDALGKKNVSHAVIGELPSRGDIVEINGLQYTVESRSKKGNLHLRLLKGSEWDRKRSC